MFKDLFKKTQQKAETAIDDVTKSTQQVMENANDLIADSKDKIKIAVKIGLCAIALNVVANIVTIFCCGRVIRSVQRNDVLSEIARMMRKGGK